LNRKKTRTPRGYDGIQPTTQKLQDILPQAVNRMGKDLNIHAEKVLKSWPEIIGIRFAPMTTAVSFVEGILTVTVTNSTLYSLLQKNEKTTLLSKLRERFPGVKIKTILFRIG